MTLISKKPVLTILILTVVIGIVIFSYFWHYWIRPDILWGDTYYSNMIGICNGISSYRIKCNRFPKSLEEMVLAGFLPEKSNIYSCPMKHGIRYGKDLLYSECEYDITFDPNKIVIYIPKEVFDKKIYKYISEKHRKKEMLKEYKQDE